MRVRRTKGILGGQKWLKNFCVAILTCGLIGNMCSGVRP